MWKMTWVGGVKAGLTPPLGPRDSTSWISAWKGS